MKAEHIIIIGGTRGLGKTLVNTLLDEGYKLSVLARNLPDKEAQIYHAQHDVIYFAADLMDDEAYLAVLAELIQTRGKINGLVFVQRYRGSGDQWAGEIQVGLKATQNIINYLVAHFEEREGSNASIIMISSVAAQFANVSQPLSYSMVKSGLNNMVRYYAAELGQYGIRVNGVSPIGFIKEESKKYYLEENDRVNRLYQKIVPLRRMCTAQDVANVISLLVDRRASFISGQNIIVDGGLSIKAHEILALEVE